MLSIDIADVARVVRSCLPGLIPFAVTATAALAARRLTRRKSSSFRKLVSAQRLLALLLALGLSVNLICLGPMSTMLTPSREKGSVSAETAAAAMEKAVEIAQEGIVLLKNDSADLPMEPGKKLNVFGWASTNPCYGGTGSGGLSDAYPKTSLLDSLTQAGFVLNDALSDFYTAYRADRPAVGMFTQDWTLPEPPASAYTQEMLDGARAFSGKAILVITRVGGEGADLPTDMTAVENRSWNDGSSYQCSTEYQQNSTEYPDFEVGEHFLELSRTERDLVQLVCSNFSDVTVIYNGANPMELGWVEEHPQIKSVLWVPGAGHDGFKAVGQILSGEVNPSGKTADTFVYDLTQTPTWNNFGAFLYDNMEEFTAKEFNQTLTPSFVNYTEGIYVGYKYYETAAKEGVLDYAAAVQYPFGYGLSYTTFRQEMGPLTDTGDALSFNVTVTNTGSVAGKDVVEVYYDPPYTNGGVEKASANLIAFEKTGLLEPGKSETLTITFRKEEMASYDAHSAGCYVLEAGDYAISLNSDSHTVLAAQSCTIPETIVYDSSNPRSSDDAAAVNQFDSAAGELIYLSRADHFANYEKATAAPGSHSMPDAQKAAFLNSSNYDPAAEDDPNAAMPVTGARNGMELSELRGARYDDPRWEPLLDQLSISDMDRLTARAGYQTPAISSVGKPAAVDADGPSSVYSNFSGQSSVAFPSAVMLANTWNKALAFDYGSCMAKMASELGISGWYAPALNIHRSAFGGRAFEYYSEDSLLTGKLAAQVVRAAKEGGVYTFLKHFALNEQETRRCDMLCTWADEQAIREIYLRPFELAVKEGGATAVMSSFNYIGTVYAGGCPALLKNVLRNEWGFRGMVITDTFKNTTFQNGDQLIRSGNDACLVAYENPDAHLKVRSASGVLALRTASKNILYTVVNSNACTPGAKNQTPGWKFLLFAADTAGVVCLAFCEYWSVKNYRKRNAAARD